MPRSQSFHEDKMWQSTWKCIVVSSLSYIKLWIHSFWKCCKKIQKKEATGSCGASAHKAARAALGIPDVTSCALCVSAAPEHKLLSLPEQVLSTELSQVKSAPEGTDHCWWREFQKLDWSSWVLSVTWTQASKNCDPCLKDWSMNGLDPPVDRIFALYK